MKEGVQSEEKVSKMAYQILNALDYLDSLNLVHRDLKLENIVWNTKSSQQLTIIDFGLATFWNQDKFLFVRCGTPGYVAPEIARCKQNSLQINSKADIFSLGCILHIILLGRPVFEGTSYSHTLQLNKICSIDFKKQIYKKISKEALNFLKGLFQCDPALRLSVKEALNNKFILNYLPKENVREEGYENNPLQQLMEEKNLYAKSKQELDSQFSPMSESKLFSMKERVSNKNLKRERQNQETKTQTLVLEASLLKQYQEQSLINSLQQIATIKDRSYYDEINSHLPRKNKFTSNQSLSQFKSNYSDSFSLAKSYNSKRKELSFTKKESQFDY